MIPTRAACLGPLILCACAARLPSPEALCGTWQGPEGMTERWWVEGKDLRGEGQTLDAAGELVSSERLALFGSRRGHVYVAEPGDAAPTEFAPIDPREARYPVEAPAQAQAWAWANYDHDFPQEIHYVLLGDTLEASIAGPGPSPDAGAGMGWTFERVAACGDDPSTPEQSQ